VDSHSVGRFDQKLAVNYIPDRMAVLKPPKHFGFLVFLVFCKRGKFCFFWFFVKEGSFFCKRGKFFCKRGKFFWIFLDFFVKEGSFCMNFVKEGSFCMFFL